MELFARICAIYARPGAADLCLRLQDQHGVDVSLALSALADGYAGRHWTPAMIAAMRRDGWDARAAVTVVLRQARQLAKPLAASDLAVAALRKGILQQELAAERVSVDWLAERLGPLPMPGVPDRAAARANLYLAAGPNVPHVLLDALADIAEG